MEAKLIQRLTAFRKDLHQHPELSSQEERTQQQVKAFLTSLGIETIVAVGGTGLLVSFYGKIAGPSVALRGDMDALPIQEINTFDHRSKTPGISHKCGHDGHTTLLLGVAAHFVQHPPERGSLHLIFQPGEEDGYGAAAILADPAFDIQPDWVFALHNLPGYPLHQVVCRPGTFTAAVQSILIRLTGKTSHAAEPEHGLNPAQAIAAIIHDFEEKVQPDIHREDFQLITPIYLQMGEPSYGVSAGAGEAHFTLRTWDNARMEALSNQLAELATSIAQSYGLSIDIDWTQSFFANQNEAQAVASIQRASQAAGLTYEERSAPFKWGEDFGLFTNQFRGAMLGLGAGEDCPALHNPDYDFPDALISTGTALFVALVEEVMKD